MAQANRNGTLRKAAFIGNYLPRKCGIATFTTDLCEHLMQQEGAPSCIVVAMNDVQSGYAYPPPVRFEINATQREQYDIAADFLNVSQVDIVCLQHEYGIFGGKYGNWIIPLLRDLSMPIVATLHTVLKEPSREQREVLCHLGDICDRLVVMSRRAITFLKEIYGIPEEKIVLIPHGIPDMPFVDPNYFKDELGLAGKLLICGFGLLGPGKGIEYMIEALPAILQKVPNAHYLYAGATHPHILREQGESYRQSLLSRIERLGIQNHVTFINRFVSLQELCQYLGAADVYVTAYPNPAQITSGTLAYAMGLGKAVVSTPYWYAEEMLADERGVLVGFTNPEELASAVSNLLLDDVKRNSIRKRAYQYCRSMVWPQVAQSYLNLFRTVVEERSVSPKPVRSLSQREGRFREVPALNLKHMLNLTDSTGILQHAYYCIPDYRHGYSTDDQARALIVTAKGSRLFPELTDWQRLFSCYTSFLFYAFDSESLRFGNFLSYQRHWVKPVATEDVHARAVWGLSHAIAYTDNQPLRRAAMHLMEQAIPPVPSFASPRAWALGILAIQTYLRKYPGDALFRRERELLAQKLFEQYKNNRKPDWPWPEDVLTYANARIPHALLEAGQWVPDPEMTQAGLEMLDWLDRIQTAPEGHFVPIGCKGWYRRGSERARFDQQPLEASAHVEACLAAFRLTLDKRWLASARRAFEWFLGRNDLNLPLCDYVTGACFDGLHHDRLNENQGAESVLSWLLAQLAIYELESDGFEWA